MAPQQQVENIDVGDGIAVGGRVVSAEHPDMKGKVVMIDPKLAQRVHVQWDQGGRPEPMQRSRLKAISNEEMELDRIKQLSGVEGLDVEEDWASFQSDENLQKLRDAIQRNIIVSVAFVKKDNTVRHMAIKQNLAAYVPSGAPKTDKQANVEQNNDLKKVVDVNSYNKKLKELRGQGVEDEVAKAEAAKGAWRSINLKNVLGFMVRGEFVDLREENQIRDRFGEEVYNSITSSMKSAMAQTEPAAESIEDTQLEAIKRLSGIAQGIRS
jgi:hypothetical protein